jgi:2'-5' RNA ligase
VRLFVAAYPPDEARAHLATQVDALAVGRAAADGVNARLAAHETWHITVAFLGDVPDERRDDVESAVARGVLAWRAQRPDGPPRLRLAGGGRFGRGRFTILWIGLGGEVTTVAALGKALRRELKRARLSYDPRPFRPHLTLARPGDRVDVRGDIAALHEYAGPEWPVDEICLMRSHLGPKPTYDRLASWPLGSTTGS